jgi:protein-tyrosine kinase
MSASVGVLRDSIAIGSLPREVATPTALPCETSSWKPDEFAREQIRGLVRRVFFAAGPHPVKQVVFSPIEPDIDVAPICDQVARALATETRSLVALLGRGRAAEGTPVYVRPDDLTSVRSSFNQMASNLWYVQRAPASDDREVGTSLHWLSCLAQLRKEFEYAVIEGPVAGQSSEAAMLGQVTDGLILVLGAHRTRKATAQKIKETLEGAQSRILGTVLSERRFPIPVGIYSRL